MKKLYIFIALALVTSISTSSAMLQRASTAPKAIQPKAAPLTPRSTSSPTRSPRREPVQMKEAIPKRSIKGWDHTLPEILHTPIIDRDANVITINEASSLRFCSACKTYCHHKTRDHHTYKECGYTRKPRKTVEEPKATLAAKATATVDHNDETVLDLDTMASCRPQGHTKSSRSSSGGSAHETDVTFEVINKHKSIESGRNSPSEDMTAQATATAAVPPAAPETPPSCMEIFCRRLTLCLARFR